MTVTAFIPAGAGRAIANLDIQRLSALVTVTQVRADIEVKWSDRHSHLCNKQTNIEHKHSKFTLRALRSAFHA